MTMRYSRELRMSITLGMVLVLTSGLAGTAANSETVEQPQLAGSSHSIIAGAYVPLIAFANTELDAFNQLIGKDAGIIHEFWSWQVDMDDSQCGFLYNFFRHDRTTSCGHPPGPEIHTALMLTWEPGQNPTNYPSCKVRVNGQMNWDAIINGSCDGYIDNFATHLKNWAQTYGDVFLIRFAHEMNIRASPWFREDPNYPAQYRAGFQHVRNRFNLVGATNQYVQFVWSPNYRSSPWVSWNSISNYYPGDAYVDWIGVSGYNWYSTPGHTAPWWTFSDIFDSPSQADPWQTNDGVKVGVLRYLMCHYAKPIIMAEIGTVEGPGGTQTKANWIADTYAKMQDFPYVRAITWFNDFAYHIQGQADFRITAGSSYDSDPLHYPGYQSALFNWTQAYKTAVAGSNYISTLPSLSSLTPSSTYCGPIPPVYTPSPALDVPSWAWTWRGGTVNMVVTLRDITTTATLSVSGLPSGYTTSFNPPTVGPFASFPYTATSLMTINVPITASVTSVPLTVRATGSGLSLSDLTTLMVKSQKSDLSFAYLPCITRP